MTEIKTKVGVLYLESEDDREEDGRLKLYDSEHRYFDYWGLDNLVESETIADLIASITDSLSNIETVDELLDMLGVDAALVSTKWEDFIPYIYGNDAYCGEDGIWLNLTDGTFFARNEVMENEWMNIVGNTYILIAE